MIEGVPLKVDIGVPLKGDIRGIYKAVLGLRV